MIRKLKTFLVGLLPTSFSLPVRYLYNRISGKLEPEIALLPSLVRPGSLTVDVGANIGFYGYALARLGARVECFEPVPACADVIRAYGSPYITVHSIGLSEAPGQAQLAVPRHGGRLATARAHIATDSQAGDTMLAIELKTLDSFGLRDVSFIKMDVEGHELSVLKGARATIVANRPILLVEIEQRHLSHDTTIDDVFSYVLELGYSGSFLQENLEVPLTGFDVRRDQLDRLAQLEEGDEQGYINNFIFRPIVVT